MNRLKIALMLSLLLNMGAVGGAAYRMLQGENAQLPGLPTYLGLSQAQRQEWQALERPFIQMLRAASVEVAGHRERLIREVFSARPDLASIESERAAIAALQAEQQRRVIEQLRRERAILVPAQRAKFAELLLRQAPQGAASIERLHRE